MPKGSEPRVVLDQLISDLRAQGASEASAVAGLLEDVESSWDEGTSLQFVKEVLLDLRDWVDFAIGEIDKDLRGGGQECRSTR